MKKKSNFVYIFTLFLVFCLAPCTVIAQSYTRHIDLTSQQASWTRVLPGELVCPPEATSYGFVVLNEGRTVTAFMDDGTIRWQRTVKGRPNPYLAVLPGDFVLTVSGKTTLTLINPEGRTLWHVRTPFAIVDAPTPGRDARIFARGKNNIACWSIKGVCKWSIKTDEQKDFPLQEFPDGSIAVMLAQTENGKSVALRVSPFGEVIERIVLPGAVTSWETASHGMLLTLSGGGVCLCAPDASRIVQTVWSIPASDPIFSGDFKNDMFFITYSTTRAALIQPDGNSAKVRFIRTSDGTITTEYSVPDIDVHHISYVKPFLRGMLFADTDTAVYCTERSERVWSAQLPKKNGATSWNYLIYTTSGYLTICKTSWELDCFRVVQSVGGAAISLQDAGDYSAFLKPVTPLFEAYEIEGMLGSGLRGKERTAALEKGMYGEKEMEWMTELNNACEMYLEQKKIATSGARVPRSLFAQDLTGTDAMMRQLAYYGTTTFQEMIAKLLDAEKSGNHALTLITVAGECAYDPDGVLIDALDNTAHIIAAKNDAALAALCDAVYKICCFMGRHDTYVHGRAILARLLYPQYSKQTRTHALDTIGKIADLAKAEIQANDSSSEN